MTQRRVRLQPTGWLAVITAIVLVGPLASANASPTATPAPLGAADASWQFLRPNNTGIPGDYVYSVAIDNKDRTWVTGDDPIWDEGGLGLQKRSRWRSWTNIDGTAATHLMRRLTFDAAGTAWMASDIGLLRLKGNNVRKVWSQDNAPWPTTVVRDFDWDSEGDLWVALADIETFGGGVARYDGTTWKVWTTANGLPWDEPLNEIYALEIDDQDRVWIGSPHMGGAMYDGSEWVALGASAGSVYDIAIAPDGTPWYAYATSGVSTWDGTGWVIRTGPFGTGTVLDVTVDTEGRVWVGTARGTIWRWSGTGSSWDVVHELPSISHVYSLAFDSENRIHVSGLGGLNVQRDDGDWDVFTTKNTALPSRFLNEVMLDDDGDAWLSTNTDGVAEYDGKRWTDFNPLNWGSAPWPFGTDWVTSTAQAPDGTIWVSPGDHGVGEWDGEQWTEHLPSWGIESLTVDPSGDVWAAPERGEVQRWNGSRWIGMDNPSGTADLAQIVADSAGNVWLATHDGLLKHNGRKWKTYRPGSSGLPSAYVTAIFPEPGGDAVWVGTDAGLARFDGTSSTVYSEADGLPADVISSISIAPNGDVWVGAWDGETAPYHGGVAVFDGASWTSYTRENSPLPHEQIESVAVGADGRVWIATAVEGMVIFTP